MASAPAPASVVEVFRAASGAPAVPNSYLIGLKSNCQVPVPASVASAAAAFGLTGSSGSGNRTVSTQSIQAIAAFLKPQLLKHGVTVEWGFDVSGVRGVKVAYTGASLPVQQLAAAVPCIAYIEEDAGLKQADAALVGAAAAAAGQQPACIKAPAMPASQRLWGLDTLDGAADGKYSFDAAGEGVNVYVVDSGLDSTHPEFDNGRARIAWTASSLRNQVQADCTGHGSHVASVLAGRHAGIAKKANVHALRIIDCGKTGAVSDAVEALSWLSKNMQLPAVINMSLGSTESLKGNTLPAAISALVSRGAALVIAAGNMGQDVCSRTGFSMTAIPDTFVVGALEKPSSPTVLASEPASFSNYGQCIKLWAPGTEIWGASNVTSGASAYEARQGTSQAAPFVAGVLALHLGENPKLTPAQLMDRITRNARPLPGIHDSAMHVLSPRVGGGLSSPSSGIAATFSQQNLAASLPFSSQCEAGGALAVLSAALGTGSTGTLVAVVCGGAAALAMGVAGVVYLARRRRAEREGGVVTGKV